MRIAHGTVFGVGLGLIVVVAAGCSAGSGGGSDGGQGALLASSGGPTLLDATGGAGADFGGDGGDFDFFADEVRLGATKVKRAKAPKTPKKADLVIGNDDWDMVDGDLADLDPDPDSIRTHGNIIVEGTLAVNGEENLESGQGGIFVDGAIVKTGFVNEVDAVGDLDDENEGELDVFAENGPLVVRGTIDLSGDDDGVSFDQDGGDMFLGGSRAFVAETGALLAVGGGATAGTGGLGGQVGVTSGNDTFSEHSAVARRGRFTVCIEGTVDVSGGASGDDGGDGGDVFLQTFEPGKRTYTCVVGSVRADGGDGSNDGGNGGLINIDGSDVGLAGVLSIRGGAGDTDGDGSGDGGTGGNMNVGFSEKARRVRVAGGEDPDGVDVVMSGGAASDPGGNGGSGDDIFVEAVLRSIVSDADIVSRGGAGDDGGRGGGVTFFCYRRGSVTNSGPIDVSGADGRDGDGGNAGNRGLDPDENGTQHQNQAAVLFFTGDGSIRNTGAITATGGSAGGATGGDGGNGGDVLFLVDDFDTEDEAGDLTLDNGREATDNEGGGFFNDATIATDGGNALVDGRGGDAGDVSMDADPNDDEVSGKGANKSRNLGDISADGGDAAGADDQGGDGGDVLLRTAGDFVNEGAIAQAAGADAGAGNPEPAVDGVPTAD